MNSSYDNLYKKMILDFARQKENHRVIKDATAAERGHNPSCGDDLTLLIKEQDSIIVDASFWGEGCAISTASTNILIGLIKGKSVNEARKITDAFFKMMQNEELTEEDQGLLGDAVILQNTADMPARIKCSTLSWHALKMIIQKDEKN